MTSLNAYNRKERSLRSKTIRSASEAGHYHSLLRLGKGAFMLREDGPLV